MDTETAQRMAEHLERVEREEREWHDARLHAAIHGNWLPKDECPVCVPVPRDLRWEQRLEDARMGLS